MLYPCIWKSYVTHININANCGYEIWFTCTYAITKGVYQSLIMLGICTWEWACVVEWFAGVITKEAFSNMAAVSWSGFLVLFGLYMGTTCLLSFHCNASCCHKVMYSDYSIKHQSNKWMIEIDKLDMEWSCSKLNLLVVLLNSNFHSLVFVFLRWTEITEFRERVCESWKDLPFHGSLWEVYLWGRPEDTKDQPFL